MPTITGQNIIDRAAIILQDTTGVRWPHTSITDELFYWLNDSQREIVLRKPDAYAVDDPAYQLVQGTRQTIPSAGIQLLDVVCNMGTGSTPGRAITRVDREILDEQRPSWHSEDAESTVKHYMFDERNPKTFYVYPPQPSTATYVRTVYSASPSNLASLSSTIVLDDVYAGVMLDYLLYRAYSKDADLSPNAPQRAVAHYQSFLAALGAKVEADAAINPNAYDYKEAVEARNVGRGQ